MAGQYIEPMQTPSWLGLGGKAPRLRPMGQCAVCRSWDTQAVCMDCVSRFAAPWPRCRRCGLRLASAAPACGTCLAEPPAFDNCTVACDYAFPWDRLIADFKFNARVELAAPLAQRLLEALRRDGGPLPQWVLPVPLAPQRLAERGYNQAWELARRVARGLGCRAHARLLDRPLPGLHQAELGLAQRRSNLRGAFVPSASRRVSLHGQHVAVVDDVMTSGATLGEAAAALRRAGAARVDAWVLARTPAPTD
jgi:ComF family protein